MNDDPDAANRFPFPALDLAIDQAAATVAAKLRDIFTTTRFGLVTVEVRNGQVYVGGGATVRISPHE